MTRIKVCCISSLDEARTAVRLGASAVGLVSAMPSGPGVIPEALIAEIAAAVPPPVATFLLTSRTDVAGVVDQCRRCGVDTVQLCDVVEPGVHRRLREALPGVAIVQVVHVTGEESVAEAVAVGRDVDALLLDSGDRTLPVKELGGTGRTHDWSLSARIVSEAPTPVYLAGGLNPDNVGAAIRTVRPYGVDLCSGVRTDDRLDAAKLKRFVAEVKAATREIRISEADA